MCVLFYFHIQIVIPLIVDQKLFGPSIAETFHHFCI